jgi:bifunctional non-homologous end joining protein LigD
MAKASSTWELAGREVAVTHLDKVYWPQDGLTKGDMLEYYRQMAPVLLRYCAGRPVTLKVYPNGIDGFSYYRRDRTGRAPDWLRSVTYELQTSEDASQLVVIDDAAGLIWAANQGAIEFHPWTAPADEVTQPDQAVFDLDPGEKADFGQALQAALHVRAALEGAGLHGYPKTSGGRGVHIYVPLAPGYSFDAVRDWVRGVAEQLAAAHPDLIEVAHGATHVGSQVTIDHAQNSIGRNTAAAYTLRARPGAPVSAPLTWQEVEASRVRPEEFNLRTIFVRLDHLGDLFEPVVGKGQRLPQS